MVTDFNFRFCKLNNKATPSMFEEKYSQNLKIINVQYDSSFMAFKYWCILCLKWKKSNILKFF